MLFAVLFLTAAVTPVIAAVTNGIYLISSKYFLGDAIYQDDDGIWLGPANEAQLGQLWSVVFGATDMATIQNVGSHAYFAPDTNFGDSIVASDTPYNWTITGDTSAATILTNGQQVSGGSEQFPLGLGGIGRGSYQVFSFVPVLPAHAYRVWNVATNLYLDQVLGECSYPEPCIIAKPLNTSSKTQVWNLGGTSSCGGKTTLQNAASGAFIASESDFTLGGRIAVLSGSAYPWTYGFVGGQLILVDKDELEDITTLTLFDGRVYLYASNEGPGTGPNQTWVFRPVF